MNADAPARVSNEIDGAMSFCPCATITVGYSKDMNSATQTAARLYLTKSGRFALDVSLPSGKRVRKSFRTERLRRVYIRAQARLGSFWAKSAGASVDSYFQAGAEDVIFAA